MNKVIIDFNKCKECYYCVTFCPKSVLKPGNEINKQGYYAPEVANQEVCIACGVCARVCPDCAISVYKEEKED